MTPSALPLVSRDLADLDPDLRSRFEALDTLWRLRYRYRRLLVTCTHRNVVAQGILWAQGRTTHGRIVTWCDGVSRKSRHNSLPAEALDVAVRLLPGEPNIVKPTVSWNVTLYRPLLALAKEVGLISGGTWKTPDWPHLELP